MATLTMYNILSKPFSPREKWAEAFFVLSGVLKRLDRM